jgi:outer membrane cobalamin receptor
MNKQIILLVAVFFVSNFILAQSYTISGYITDAKNGEVLIGANVYNAKTYTGSITNAYGFYSLTLPEGAVDLTISYVGYATWQKEVLLTKNITISIEMNPSIEISEVLVEGARNDGGVESSQMSLIDIPMKTIKNLPSLLGEADIIKTIQLLPGVQSGSEGMSGMYVRGGGPDQNLILLDGVPVYNVNHLFGFFSVFNPDAIQNVKLVKGGFPAHYGGRLSSVLDISMKEGNNKEFHGTGSVGIISSKLALEGPIGDKTSFIVTGRRTYLDVLTYPFQEINARNMGVDESQGGYFFYDVNAKINHKFSDKSRLYLSAYAGKDKFYLIQADSYTHNTYNPDTGQDEIEAYSYRDEAGFYWGNFTTALRWNYALSDKLFSNTTATFSQYKMVTGAEEDYSGQKSNKFEYQSGIVDWGGKIDFDYFPQPNHYIKFGIGNTYHTYNPGAFAVSYNANNDEYEEATFGNNKLFAHEMSLYAEDDIRIGALLKLNVGIHWSGFLLSDKFYNGIEPRISGRFLLSDKWSVKGSYAKMNQYINLLATAKIGLPTDLWVPSTKNLPPQKAQQFALGSSYEINPNYEITVEGFYKTMDNLVEYKEGSSIFSFENDWESKVALGKGWSYGLELLLMKKMGNTTGWIGYTWSKSDRQFNRPGQEISFGEKFPYTYDRRHDISIVISRKVNEHIDLGITWVFGTGNATTLSFESYPQYSKNNNFEPYQSHYGDIAYYEGRNNFRMPAYHRLDVGVNFHKEKKWGRRTWNVSIYNAYNRQNPFFLDFGYDYESDEPVLYQYSLFPIIPSVSYHFEF